MRAGACTGLIIGLFLAGVLGEGVLCAQTPRPNLDWELERVGVPEDTPLLWPWGNEQWEAIPRDEFEQLWAQRHASRQSPKTVWIESLHAEAVLTDATLRAGRLTAQIRSSDSQVSLLPLEPFNVALTELTWSTGPAVWGCDASGRCWLVVPPGNHQLNGRWTAKGHQLTAGVEFELQWPQSAITSLELLAPPTFMLEVSTGEIIRQPNSETDFARWRIELGTALGTQIRARTTSSEAPTPHLALASQEFSGLVREEEIRFQSLTNVELLGNPRSELVFLVGGEIEIFSVSLGADATLPHLLEPGPGRRKRLVVSLPEPMSGRLRPIRIDGLASRRPGTPASAPSLFLENAVFQGTRYTLTIPGPLQMRSLRAEGFRQTGAPLLTPAGEAWTFEQSIPEGRLIFDVRRPESSPSMQGLTQVVAGSEIWTMTAQLRWTVPSGSIFQLTCRIPPSWEVTDVRTLANSQAVEIAAWELQPQPEGDVQLAVELVRAVTPDRPGVIEILANRRVPRPGVPLEPPVFQPLDCETVEQTLLIDSSGDWVPRFNNASGFEEIAQTTLENSLQKSFRWPPLVSGNRLVFRASEITSPSTWRMVPRENPAEISATFDLLIEEDRLTERWELTAKPLRGPLEHLVISLRRADEFTWTLKDTANTRSIPVQIQPLVDPLAEANGTEFRLSWPTGLEGSFTLEGSREQPRVGVLEIPLLFCKSAERFEGLATVHAATPPNVALQALGATPLTEEAARGGVAETADPWSRSWSYRGPDASLELRQPDHSSDSESPLILAVELRSLVSANAIGQDLHRARFQIANAAEAGVFRFKLDSSVATLLSATVNGQRVAPTPFEASWVVPGLTGTGNDLVEILYRTAHPNSLLGDRRKIILPVPEGQVVNFEWNFAISPMAHLFQAPTGVRVREVLTPTPWTTRIFGPLARGTGSIFVPFFPETWSDLVYRPRPASTPLGDLDTNLIAPVEWQEYHAVAPTLPEEITLTTWHIYRLQLFEWCILLFCLLVVLVLRLLRWPARRTGIAAGFAICLPASLFGDQPGAELFGAAFSGLLLASLVPRQWLIGVPTAEVPDAAVPTGSTQSFRVPAGHFATSLLVIGIVSWLISQTGVWAQEAPPPENASAATLPEQTLPATRFRILVPLGKDRQPSRNLPVVYVPRVLAKSLRAAAQPMNVAPTILLTSATYRVEIDQSRLTTVRAILDFHRLNHSELNPNEDVLRLPLPFTDVNLGGASACLIDGRPFPVRRAVNGIGWEVEVLAKDLPTTSPQAPVTVELELLLARTRATSGQEILFGIPASGATQAVLNFDAATIDLALPESKGEVVLSLNRQSATASLGQVTKVHFQWRTADDAPPPPTTITPRLLQAVSFSPLLTEVRFRVDVQIDSGSVTALSWQLPKGCYLRSLRSGADFRWHTTVNAEGKTRIDLSFLEPRHQTFLIEGTYLQPIDSAQTPRSCPPLEWLPTANIKLVPGTIWAGFAPAAGFQLQALVGQDVQNPIGRIEEFLTAWGLPAPQMRPEIVQQIKADTETQFLLVPRIGERVLSQLHHSATIDRRRINWVSQADVQIREGSIFSYSFLVDRRLQVEQISVQDGGAERIFRWSSSRLNSLQNRVVIFLREPASQRQTITIRGNMPFRVDLPTTFPSLRFEDAELIDGRLLVLAPKAVSVEFIPGRTLEPTDEINGFPEIPSDLASVGHYLLREPDLVASFEVLTPEKPGQIQTLVILEISEDRTVDVRGTSLLLKEDGPPSEVFVTVPQLLAQAGIDFPDSQSQLVSEDQQQQTWRLQAQNFPEQAPRISWRANGPYDAPDEWWQRPRFRNADQEELYLALIPADASAPENLEAIDPGSLPEEFRKLLQLSTEGQMAAVYRSDASQTPQWSELSPPEATDTSVSVERHTIWVDPNGRLQGTSKFLGLPLEASLSVAIPPEIEIQAVFVNDRALLPRRNSDGNLQIAGLGGTPSETATLIWSREIEPFAARGWGSAAETLPHLALQTARSSTVAVIPPEGWQLWAPSGGKPVSWFQTTLPSIRWWLEEARRSGSADSHVSADLHREYQTILRDFPLETESGDLNTSDLAAWNTFIAELNQTGFLQDTAIPTPTTFKPRAEALAGHPEVWRAQFAVKSPTPPVRFWVIDTHRLMIYPAIAVGLLLFAGFTLMKGYDLGSWLAVSPSRSGWILGFLWWLFFSPSILGFALLALLVVREIRERATAPTRGVMVG